MKLPRRLIAQYLVMVGVPVAGILLVLQLGRGLTGAPAIGGRWQLRPAPGVPISVGACVGAADSPPWMLVISQSGEYITARLSGGDRAGSASLEGVLHGRTLRLTAPAGVGTCHGPVALTAEVIGDGTIRRLEGRLHQRGSERGGAVRIEAVPLAQDAQEAP